MKSIVAGVCGALFAVVALLAQSGRPTPKKAEITPPPEIASAVGKGAKWLVSVQGDNGGWGQDGGETSYVRVNERLESTGNDVANTAVAALALLRAGSEYRPNVERALRFILTKVEASPATGLAITDQQGTQIQRKLGTYIDTFLTSMLLAQVDGTLSKEMNARVRKALEKCVAKIEANQQQDGSWNVGGGWAPVLGTSLASRSLFEAGRKGVEITDIVMRRAEDYTIDALNTPSVGMAASAGVPLYQSAQAIEQLSRTDADRQRNAVAISRIQTQLADSRFVEGFGSVGGEEYFSYLNVSDSLQRGGGTQWKQWHGSIVQKILNMQNADGTWSGHHCITGRVAVTSAAMLNLTVGYAN